MNSIITAVIASLLVCGCTSVLSSGILREADASIAFPDLQKDPGQYHGAVVVLGGQILEVVVKERETRVQVLQLPLGAGQRPDNRAPSQGRFLVVYERFADPLIYEKGRKITVAGVVEGDQAIMLHDRPYPMPVLLERETYLWKTEEYPAYAPGPAVQFGIGVGGSR
ncbi:MAG TPA: Slp family lipoprotein [Syntrophales bacterium]|nr:Slp family lipoprotein [Syntrophales bacterium]